MLSEQQSETKDIPIYIVTNQILGKGGLGTVYRGYNSMTKQQFAFKKMLKTKKNEELYKEFYAHEIRALKDLKDRNGILKFITEYSENNCQYIVSEMCSGGNLSKKIKQNSIQRQEAFLIMKQILKGYIQIYSLKYVHRDLKPSNILIHQSGQIKIADFGFAIKQEEVVDQFNNVKVGSINFMAPEVIKLNKYSYRSDIWALGLIFYELCYGSKLWKLNSQRKVFQTQMTLCRQPHHFAKQISGIVGKFLYKTLCLNQYARAGPQQLLLMLENQTMQKNISKQTLMVLIEPKKGKLILKTYIQYCSFIMNLIDLIVKLMQEYEGFIDTFYWNKFLKYMKNRLLNICQQMKGIQKNLEYQQNSMQRSTVIKIRKLRQIFELIEMKVRKQKKYHQLIQVRGGQQTENQLQQFLELLDRQITQKFPYRFFLLYDYIVTFSWITSMIKDDILNIRENSIDLMSIIDSLNKNLQKSQKSHLKIKTKDLNLLRYKVTSLKSII